MAPYKLQELPPEREPMLPPDVREYLQRVAGNRELARDFLKRAGIMDENGDLAQPYRADKYK